MESRSGDISYIVSPVPTFREQEQGTYVHIGSKEHDGARVELVRNDNLGVLAITVFTDSDLWGRDLDQLGWHTAVRVWVVLPLIKVGLDRGAAEVRDRCSAKLGWLD